MTCQHSAFSNALHGQYLYYQAINSLLSCSLSLAGARANTRLAAEIGEPDPIGFRSKLALQFCRVRHVHLTAPCAPSLQVWMESAQ